MKAYGIKRVPELDEYPDKGDIKGYALKSSTGQFKTKSGEFRGMHKSKQAKANTRRIYKKRERINSKMEIQNVCIEISKFFL